MQVDLEELISLREDSHAKPSAMQDYKEQQKMIVGSGMKCLELFKLVNQDGLLERMSQVLLTSTKGFYSSKCKLIWKKKVTPFNRLLLALVPKMLPISETESGSLDTTEETNFWLTPSATNVEMRSEESLNKRKEYRLNSGRQTVPPGNLAEQVTYGKPVTNMLPTPRAVNPGSRPNGKGGKVLSEEILIMEGIRERGKKLTQMFPTPQAKESGRKIETWKKAQKEWKKKGVNLQMGLSQAVQMFPTPNQWDGMRGARSEKHLKEKKNAHQITLVTAVAHLERQKMYPTPNAGLVKHSYNGNNQYYENRIAKGKQQDLAMEIYQTEGVGQLNAEWVTWMMGYPKHYLDISQENQKTFQELQETKKTEPKS